MKLFGHEWTFKKNSDTKNFLEMVVDEREEMHLCLYAYALHVVIDLIASIMSNIEFKTYAKDDVERNLLYGRDLTSIRTETRLQRNS